MAFLEDLQGSFIKAIDKKVDSEYRAAPTVTQPQSFHTQDSGQPTVPLGSSAKTLLMNNKGIMLVAGLGLGAVVLALVLRR